MKGCFNTLERICFKRSCLLFFGEYAVSGMNVKGNAMQKIVQFPDLKQNCIENEWLKNANCRKDGNGAEQVEKQRKTGTGPLSRRSEKVCKGRGVEETA